MDTYEKKYREAKKWIESIYPNLSHEQQMEAEAFFPGLKENEDERIRKGLIKAVSRTFEGNKLFGTDVTREEALSWLEKQSERKSVDDLTPQEAMDIAVSKCFNQGEQKSTIEMKSAEESLGIDSETYNKIVDECIYGEQKSADRIEPKFKVGDWIIDKESKEVFCISKNLANTYKVIDIEGNSYHVLHYTFEEDYILWTIQDAKDGDVLITNSNIVFIFKYLDEGGTIAFHASCTKNSGVYFPKIKERLCDQDVHPATKEQRDLLFAKMKEEGHEWDAEKKELKRVSQRMISAEVKEAMYAKPAWSEEDEITRKTLVNIINAHYKDCFGKTEKCLLLNWLKYLKQRIESN